MSNFTYIKITPSFLQKQNLNVKTEPLFTSTQIKIASYHRTTNLTNIIYMISLAFTYFMWISNKWVVSTSFSDDVTDQMFLPIIRGQYGDLLRGPSYEAHIHEHCHYILSFS